MIKNLNREKLKMRQRTGSLLCLIGGFLGLMVGLTLKGDLRGLCGQSVQESQSAHLPAEPSKRDWTTGTGWSPENRLYRTLAEHEGGVESFLGEAAFESAQLFTGDRFPNLVVAMDGTVIAVWNGVQVCRSPDGGESWGDPIPVGKGLMGGGVTVDEISGDILVFVEDQHPPAPLQIYRSADQGLTWQKQEFEIHPNSLGHRAAMHMNEHGITLRHGPYKGRLIRPSRWYGRSNYPAEHFPTHYTNAIFSDDGGRSWKSSEPFPVMGTGEACLAELSDGKLIYNTRRHWAPEAEEARWRWQGESRDGGLNWQNPERSLILPDGDRASTYGLMGGMVRLPVLGRDILIYSNIVSPQGRKNGHVWASFDGGKTWPLRREVFSGNFAYSALNAGRPRTPSEGWIYLLYEGGPEGGGTFCRFNLSWILAGERTADGEVPEWLPR
jgi:sialidase-1